MKPIHIFRTGKHTSAGGITLDFTADMLREAAEAYDPALHEAPIVVGHPKDNGPAFGWISGLTFSDDGLHATPDQVNTDFEELVETGAYKKVSASLYTPDAPANPTPGKYYVRHVGFLGAMPPSIKGLDALAFNEGDEGVVEFSADWEIAGIFRRLREFLIEKFGIEDADNAIPGYLVESAEDIARNPEPKGDLPEFSENGDTTMTEAELKAANDKLEADQAAFAEQQTTLAAKQADFAEKQEAATAVTIAERKTLIGSRVDKLVQDGKVLPAKADAIKDFAEKLGTDDTVEFGEGDNKATVSATDFLFDLLDEGKTPVDFGEHGKRVEGKTDDIKTSEELAAKALEYQEERAQAGTVISVTEAVNHIQGLK